MKSIRASLARPAAIACVALTLVACVSDQQKVSAIIAVNQGFRIEYEKLLAEKGTRVFRQSRNDAFLAMRVALAGLGMRTEQQDVTLGHLATVAPAPLPLTRDEWRVASKADLPLLQGLIEPEVGFASNFVKFEPQGLEVVINATFRDGAAGTEVSLTVRLREVAPPKSGWPRKEYVSPHVLDVGLDKIFGAFERELQAGPPP